MLEETDRVFSCEFCRVRSFILPITTFRYMFTGRAPAGKKLFYFPFWRFKGMFFACSPAGIQHRFMDLSHQAVRSSIFPLSVGLRSQTLKLKFISPEDNGRFLTPGIPLKQAMEVFDRQYTRGIRRPILHQTHIGETLGLIYSPFYADKRLYDAILNAPAGQKLPEDFDPDSLPGGPPEASIRFLATLCPNCGRDLTGGRDSVALNCLNCGSMWQAGKRGLKRIHFAHWPAAVNPAVYLPFWRIKADIVGIRLDSYADLVREANLPRVVKPAWESTEFRFWIPAFKVRPRTFLRLSNAFTLSQPRQTLEPTLPEGRMHPVNLPVSEAIEALKTTLAGFLRPAKRMISILPDIQIRATSYLLVYIPFMEKPHELINQKCRTAVNKNQLRFSSNL